MKCRRCKCDISKSKITCEIKLGVYGIPSIDSWIEGELCLECAKKLAVEYNIIDADHDLLK